MFTFVRKPITELWTQDVFSYLGSSALDHTKMSCLREEQKSNPGNPGIQEMIGTNKKWANRRIFFLFLFVYHFLHEAHCQLKTYMDIWKQIRKQKLQIKQIWIEIWSIHFPSHQTNICQHMLCTCLLLCIMSADDGLSNSCLLAIGFSSQWFCSIKAEQYSTVQ